MTTATNKVTSLKAKKEAAVIEYNNKLALTEGRYVLHKIGTMFSDAYNDNIDGNVVIHNSFGDFYQVKTDKDEFYNIVSSILKNEATAQTSLHNLNMKGFVDAVSSMVKDPANGLSTKHATHFKKIVADDSLAARLISQCEDDASSISDMAYMCDESFLNLVSLFYSQEGTAIKTAVEAPVETPADITGDQSANGTATGDFSLFSYLGF